MIIGSIAFSRDTGGDQPKTPLVLDGSVNMVHHGGVVIVYKVQIVA